MIKNSFNVNKQCVIKILKYTDENKQVLQQGNIETAQDLERSLSPKYAVTQLITNIYEVSKKLQPDILQSLTEFNRIKTRTARQIASHDYVKVDFNIILNICKNLTKDNVIAELNNFLKGNDNED